jgi:hypothetical protein
MTTLEKEPMLALKEQHKVVAAQHTEIDNATLKAAGLTGIYKWHYGTVNGLGDFSQAGGHEVVILWDEGGASRMQGGLTDQEWEIFKLAFAGTGRISVLSDKPTDPDWKFDYRFLEAHK